VAVRRRVVIIKRAKRTKRAKRANEAVNIRGADGIDW
jgi:hypothetical protein